MSNEGTAREDMGMTSSASRTVLRFATRHGAPFILAGLLWYVLWWGHSPDLQTPEDAMRHVSLVGLAALAYLAAQIRVVASMPRKGVVHPVIEVMISLLPLLVILYAGLDWARGARTLSVFQVVVLQQAAVAVLIDVFFFTYISLRLAQHSLPVAVERS